MRGTMLTSLTLMMIAVAALADPPPTTAPASSPAPASTQPVVVPSDLRIVEQWIERLGASASIDSTAREAIAQMWSKRQPGDDPRAMMRSALAILSPAYGKAMDALDAGRSAEAIETIQPALASPEFPLATHAAMALARALVEEDRLEPGLKALEQIDATRERVLTDTLVGPEMLFLLGYCRLANLQYDQAIQTLQAFERFYPEAPDQYRLPVRQMLQELAARQPEGLGDVSDLMAYAQRQLKHVRTGEPVQTRQRRAVELLDKLVDDAEQREQQAQQQQAQSGGAGGSQQKGGRAQGHRAAQRGADRSVLPGGESRIGELHRSARARPGEEWGKMRPEDRERILQAVRQNFPSRYRQLVEQYYKQLAKEE